MNLWPDDTNRRAALSMVRWAVPVRLGSPAPEMPGGRSFRGKEAHPE